MFSINMRLLCYLCQCTLIPQLIKMMWKTLIVLAVTSIVLAGKINNKRNANYSFQIKHDYDYLKRHEKSEQNTQEEEKGNEEEITDEPEQTNESDVSNDDSEESEKNEENETFGYEFLYKVNDPYKHDKKGQHEEKHGDEIKGVYWLLQPDGYKRTVDYHVDKHNGFQAKVEYSKSEELTNEEEHSKPKSEYYIKTYRGSKKYIPIKEEEEGEQEQEQDRQEESAQNVPIYVI